MKDETLAIHHGYTTDATTKAVATPIYQSVAFEFDNAQHGADLFDLTVPGNIYSRIMNPTHDVLEQRVAELEHGIAALAVASASGRSPYADFAIFTPHDKRFRMVLFFTKRSNMRLWCDVCVIRTRCCGVMCV